MPTFSCTGISVTLSNFTYIGNAPMEICQKLEFIPCIMKFIRKTGRFTISLLLIFYFSAVIESAADHASGKGI